MAKYSKRRRSRRGSKRKKRGGDVVSSLNAGVGSIGDGLREASAHVKDAVDKSKTVVGKAGEGLSKTVDEVKTGLVGASKSVEAGVTQGANRVGSTFGNVTQRVMTGGRRGGSGRCCFPAKFCGSRKRKGNKRRSIRTGRCCLPVKSKKCGAKKKNGRKTKKNKRKRKSGMFNMFGGGG